MKDVDTQRCLIMQKTGTATWDLTSLRRPREGVSPPSLQHQDRRTCSFRNHVMLSAVLQTRIHRIRMFLGLLDPDPLIRGTDPDLSIINLGLDQLEEAQGGGQPTFTAASGQDFQFQKPCNAVREERDIYTAVC